MRIQSSNGVGAQNHAAAGRRASGSAFSLPSLAPAEGQAASAPRSVANIDVLISLQEVLGPDDAAERRGKAVKRGRSALDVLDDLKIGLLSGSMDDQMVQRLKSAAAELKSASGDPGLDQVLSEIELRVEVELAKVAIA